MKKDLYSKECPSGGSFDNINKENKLSESSYPKKFSWPTDGFWHYKLLNRHLTFYCFRPPTRRQQTTHDLTYPLNNCPILFKSESNSIFFGPLVTVHNSRIIKNFEKNSFHLMFRWIICNRNSMDWMEKNCCKLFHHHWWWRQLEFWKKPPNQRMSTRF